MDRTANYLNLIAIISFSGVITTACSDSFMQSSVRNKTSGLAALSTTIDEAGNITATIDPNATTTQIMRFDSGALAGSAIAIPPGSLSIPVSITVGEGETLSSSEFLQTLGITSNNVTAAGPSVSFVPSSNVEATNPFTLSLPLSVTSSLALTSGNENIVVMYRWMKVVNGETTYSMGIIPGNEVTISNDKVSFQTTKFGVFQLAKSEAKITERVNVPTNQPPALKKDAGNPLIGKWSICSSEVSRKDKWGVDPLQVDTIMGGNNEPNYNPGGPGPGPYQGFYGFGANLNWQGGRSPFKVERSFDNFATSSVVAPQLNNWNLQDASIPAGKTSAQYRITDSSGNSTVAATSIPKYLKVTNIQTTSENTTITWSSNGSNFKVYEWGQDNCSGSKTEKYSGQVTNAIIAFGDKLMLSLSVQDTDAGTSSQCLTIMRRGGIDVVTSRIEPSASDTSKFKLTLKWLGTPTPTPSFTLQRFSDATCQTEDASTPVATNSYTMDDLAQGLQFFVKVSSGAILSQCLPIKIPGGGSIAADIKVTLVETSAPAYDSTQGRVTLGWGPVPEKTRFKVSRFDQADCNSAGRYIFSSDDQNRMFTDNYPMNGSYSYIVETEKLTTNKKSHCINVNMSQPAVVQRFPAYVRVKGVTSMSSTVSIDWDGGQAPFTVTRYNDQACSQFNENLGNRTERTFRYSPTVNGVQYVNIKDNWGNVSACVAVSKAESQAVTVSSIASYENGAVVLSWIKPGSATSAPIVERFNTADCSGTPIPIRLVNNIIQNFTDSPPNGAQFSYKITYSDPHIMPSGCTPVGILRPIDRLIQPVAWTSVTTSGRSVSLSWNGNFSGQLKYYEAKSCSGTPNTLDITGQQMMQVAALNPATEYSFEIQGTINDTTSSLPCITAKTPSFDPFVLTAAQAYGAEISVPITINVKTDEAHDIMVEYRDQTMSNQTWTSINKSNNGTTTLKIAGSTLIQANAQMSLRTTENCYFATGGFNFSNILLTNANTKLTTGTNEKYEVQLSDLTITCNSSDNNDGDGGGNFGPPGDSSMFSKRATLVIAPGGFTYIEDNFLSPDCTKDRVSSLTELGAYVLPGPDSVSDTYPIDVTPKELSGIFFMQEMVDRANNHPEQFACGVGGWVVNKSQSLTNTKCASTGKTDYIRLKVIPSQTAGDRLYPCDPPDKDSSEYGKTAATRIPTCDITSESFYFKRQ